MSITDELREWARDNTVYGESLTTYPVQHPVHGTRESLLAIADRIDAAAADMQSFCDRLRDAAERLEDVTLFGVDYMAPPIDLDGEPWYVGDEIAKEHNTHVTVSEIAYKGNGRWMLRAEPNWSFYANIARHHHPPTVDGILRDFGVDIAHALDADPDAIVPEAIIAEYAAKLRLRSEDE